MAQQPAHRDTTAHRTASLREKTSFQISAPWKPEYSFLAQRLAAFNFPQQTDIGYHVHAQLNVYANGKQVTVPANVGIDPQGRFISPIHRCHAMQVATGRSR